MIFAALSSCFIAVGGYFAFGAYPDVTASAAFRSGGLFLGLLECFTGAEAHVPFWTMLGAAVYSFISITLIHYYFEKTQSQEILFICFFVISLAFEFARIIIPLKWVFNFPSLYVITASRVLLFGRYFGLFSLFVASVYAAGLDAQKQQNIIFVLVMAALIVAMNVPVDSLIWDSSLKNVNSYNSMFIMVEAGILACTILTFFVSAYTRGSRAYVFIGIGILLVFTGRNLLIKSDTWITPLPGLVILSAGTWLVSSRLHREYLWL